MIEGFASLEPLRQGDVEYLAEAAKSDKHGVILPTDVIWQDGQRVGFLSIGALPTVMAWLSTKDMKPRESFHIVQTMEAICRRQAPGVYVPMPVSSPFHPLMERMGYTNGGTYDFFFKRFI